MKYERIERLGVLIYFNADDPPAAAVQQLAHVTETAAKYLAGCRNGQRVRVEVVVEAPAPVEEEATDG